MSGLSDFLKALKVVFWPIYVIPAIFVMGPYAIVMDALDKGDSGEIIGDVLNPFN